MPLFWRPIGDPLRRSTALWLGVIWGIAFACLIFGGVYLALGLHAVTVNDAFKAVTNYVPGGMQTYGAGLLICGLGLLHGLLPATYHRRYRRNLLVGMLRVTAGYSFAVAFAFACSWALTGTQTWTGMTYWTTIAFFSLLAKSCPPDAAPGSRRAP